MPSFIYYSHQDPIVLVAGAKMLRSSILALALMAIGIGVAHSQATPANNAPGITRRLEGQLVFVDLHDEAGGEQWAIVGTDGVLAPFNRGVKPPKKDKNGSVIELGAVVGLNCPVDPTTGQCSYVSASDTTLLGGASMPTATGKPIVQKNLIMILDYSLCGYAPTLNETVVRTLYLGASQDGSGGHALKFEQCSYGSFTLNATAFTALAVAPNCSSTAITTSCSWSEISNTADTAAKALLGTTAFSGYTHYTYVLPPAFESICGWSGLALLPGKQTWLQTSSYGVNRWATVMQESIHNYGLWHSWQNGREYNDYSTAMGWGDVCPNAAEISRMGWASAASGGVLNSTTLATAGAASSFNMPATYLTGSGNYLRVQPNWVPSYGNATLAKNLYIAVRAAKIGDAALGASYAAKINIHEVNATMDNAYPTSYSNGDRKISFLASVTPGTQLTLPSYNLVVYGGSWVGSDILRVYVCRFLTSDTECPLLSYLESRPSPPPSPTPPSPGPPSPLPPSPSPPSPLTPTRPPTSPSPPHSPLPPSPRPPPPPPPPKNNNNNKGRRMLRGG